MNQQRLGLFFWVCVSLFVLVFAARLSYGQDHPVLMPVEAPPPDGPPSVTSEPGAGFALLHLDAARTCFAEASFARDDCSAILHLIDRRARKRGVAFEIMLKAYSALWNDPVTPRKLRVRGLPWGDARWFGKRQNLKWASLRAHVIAYFQGTVRNPCPTAWHFGGAMDAQPLGHIPARCSRKTSNIFYARKP